MGTATYDQPNTAIKEYIAILGSPSNSGPAECNPNARIAWLTMPKFGSSMKANIIPTETKDIVTGKNVSERNKVDKYTCRGCKTAANKRPKTLASNTVPINHLIVLNNAIQKTKALASIA